MRRNLVIVRAGDSSLHTGWLGDESARNWDIIVSYYGDDPNAFRDRGQRRIDAKGPKWTPLKQVIGGELRDEIAAYDYVWLPDDDLESDMAAVNRLFDTCREFQLELAQPSLNIYSIIGHLITITNKSYRLRYTNFVEIMAPCFSQPFLQKCWPTFDANNSGWGLDYLWPTWASNAAKVAVIDEVSMRHTRARGPLYGVLSERGADPQREMQELILKERLRPFHITMGGVDRAGELHALWNGNYKKLIKGIGAGYLPELVLQPEHIYSLIEPILLHRESPATSPVAAQLQKMAG